MKISEGRFITAVMITIMVIVSIFTLQCSNTPTTETVAVDSVVQSDNWQIIYARAITSQSKWNDTLSNGDIRQITYTPSVYVPSSYTASKLDTVLIRKDGTAPPVDTVVVPPTTNYGTLIYSSGYSSIKDLDPFQNNQYGNGSISTTVYKTGPGSFHSVPASVSSGIRSEVQYPDGITPKEGTIVWDVMYVKVQQDNIHSLQIHPNTGGGSASPGLWHVSGQFYWVNWKGGTNTKYPTGVTIQTNHWYHMVFQYKYGSIGYMKFTVDGKVVLDRTGIQVNDGSGGYLKVGTNSWSGNNSEAYYDNLEIWQK